MKYRIVARIEDDSFNSEASTVIGYMVMDEQGRTNIGAIQKIYNLYKQGKIEGAEFDSQGNVNLRGMDNRLLPVFNSCAFNDSGVPVYAVVSMQGDVCQLKDRNGETYSVRESDVLYALSIGSYKLSNARVIGGHISYTDSIVILSDITKAGMRGYRVLLSTGEIKTLTKQDVVENLIQRQGKKVLNAKIVDDRLQAKDGVLPKVNLDTKQTPLDIKKPESKPAEQSKENKAEYEKSVPIKEIKVAKELSVSKGVASAQLIVENNGNKTTVKGVANCRASDTKKQPVKLSADCASILNIENRAFQRYNLSLKLNIPHSLSYGIVGEEAFSNTTFVDGSPFVVESEGTFNLYLQSRAFCRSTIQELPNCKIAPTVGERAFYKSNIQAVNFMTLTALFNGVNFGKYKIGNEAFRFSDLRAVAIPPVVKEVGSKAFADCSHLKEVSLNSGYIRARAFQNSAVEKLSIGASVRYIENRAFGDCNNLTTVHIPSTVCYVHPDAFAYCKNLRSIIVPYHLKDAFSGSKSLINTEIQVYDSKKNFVKANIDPTKQECVGINTYLTPSTVTFVAIPDGVKSYKLVCKGLHIRDYDKQAPAWCRSLSASYNFRYSYVSLPDTLQIIESRRMNKGDNCLSTAFYRCVMVNGLPNRLKQIGDYTFRYCVFDTIHIPIGVKTIGISAFYGCTADEVVISDSVEVIKERAFQYCNITSLKLGRGVKRIEARAFADTSLKTVYIPPQVEYVDPMAFFAESIEKIYVPEHLKDTFKDTPYIEEKEVIVYSIGYIMNQVKHQQSIYPELCKDIVFSTQKEVDDFGQLCSAEKVRFFSTVRESRVIVKDGVTKLPNGFFNVLLSPFIELVSLPKSLQYIGSKALRGVKLAPTFCLPYCRLGESSLELIRVSGVLKVSSRYNIQDIANAFGKYTTVKYVLKGKELWLVGDNKKCVKIESDINGVIVRILRIEKDGVLIGYTVKLPSGNLKRVKVEELQGYAFKHKYAVVDAAEILPIQN